MNIKILIAEDNDNNRYLTQFLLEQQGFTVVTAINGNDAIKTARTEKPDLILMDIQMPELDGYETTKLLQADNELKHIPVVGVSSYAMAGDREKAIESGFSGYIEKPINPETFCDEIKAYLNL
jgi:two-component system, cell cycle response regulator DivK